MQYLLKEDICVKAKEILNILTTPWCSNQDIMKIINVSSSTTSKIKRYIEIEYRKKYTDNFMPAHCVPTKDVIKYFDIDIEFRKSLASIDLDDIDKK